LQRFDAGAMTTVPTIIREARRDDLKRSFPYLPTMTWAGTSIPSHRIASATTRAFETIVASPDQVLQVAERDGEVVGTFETFIATTLSRRGASSTIV
jgi:hypothetical protein